MDIEPHSIGDSFEVSVPATPDFDLLFTDPERARWENASLSFHEPERFPALVELSAALERVFSNDGDGTAEKTMKQATNLLAIPHVLAQCCRSAANVVAVNAMTEVGGSKDLRVQSSAVVVSEASCDIQLRLGGCVSRQGALEIIVLLIAGALLPYMIEEQDRHMTEDLLRFLSSLSSIGPRNEGEAAAFSPPFFGESLQSFASRNRRLAENILGREILETLTEADQIDQILDDLEKPTLLKMKLSEGPEARRGLQERRPRLVQDSLLGLCRKPQYFAIFFASPSRAPLTWPPFDSRETVSPDLLGQRLDYVAARRHLVSKGNAEASDYRENAKAQLRKFAPKPSELRSNHLPLCALSAIRRATDKSLGGEGDVWHNKDRMLTANFLMDIGDFDIEDMGKFISDRLSIADAAYDKSRHRGRAKHFLSHVKRHSGVCEDNERKGYPPRVTSTCEWLSDSSSIDGPQSFHCPFVAPFTGEDEKELKALLDFQGEASISASARQDILSHARRGDRQAACLAHYNATQPDSAYKRHRLFQNPVSYTFAKVLSARHHQ